MMEENMSETVPEQGSENLQERVTSKNEKRVSAGRKGAEVKKAKLRALKKTPPAPLPKAEEESLSKAEEEPKQDNKKKIILGVGAALVITVSVIMYFKKNHNSPEIVNPQPNVQLNVKNNSDIFEI